MKKLYFGVAFSHRERATPVGLRGQLCHQIDAVQLDTENLNLLQGVMRKEKWLLATLEMAQVRHVSGVPQRLRN